MRAIEIGLKKIGTEIEVEIAEQNGSRIPEGSLG